MGVPCRRCGRSYDVSLFAFGRTIDCTCGQRVGLEMRISHHLGSHERRFIADAMLGRLARWLRVLGIDTAYERDIEDAQLVERALAEGRVILTRDRSLSDEWRVEGIFLIASEELHSQLRQVIDDFGLRPRIELFVRCLDCNMRLEEIDDATAQAEVPPRVYERGGPFRRCPRCRRLYWAGSHTDRMERVIARVLAADPSP